jgi:hypothetical protein
MLFLGSSPTAPEALERARREIPGVEIVTTNRGILLEPVPSVYFLSDSVAISLFLGHATEAQRQGTRLVTLERDAKSLRKRGLEHFDEFVPDNCRGWELFSLSGTACLEYAARSSSIVALVGAEGYPQSKEPANLSEFYFPHELDYSHIPLERRWWLKANHRLWNLNKLLREKTQAIVDKYPGVEFLFYGKPRYEIEAPNWREIPL